MSNLPFPTDVHESLPPGYEMLEFTSAADPTFHFLLAVKNGWDIVDIAEDPVLTPENPLASLAVIRSSSALIEVAAALLPREVSPSDWLEEYLRLHKHEVVAERKAPSAFGEVGDFLSRFRINDDAWVARSLAIKDDDRLFLFQGRAPEDDYPRVAEVFLIAIQSFRLLGATTQTSAEPLAVHAVDEPVSCNFSFPASWEYEEEEVQPAGGAAFSLLNLREEQLDGQFYFSSLPHDDAPDAQALLTTFVERLRAGDARIDLRPLVAKDAGPGLKGAWLTRFPASRGKAPLDVQFCVAEHPEAWFVFSLIGVAEEANREAAMTNRRAFELALTTFRLDPDE